MKRLKNILQSKYFYLVLFVFLVIYILINTIFITYQSNYENGINTITGKVLSYTYDDEKLVIILKAKEKIKATYYDDDIKVKIGSIITITGNINDIANNTIPNTFNYKEYLYHENIYKVMTIKSFDNVDNNINILDSIKDYIINKSYINSYISLFIIGNKSLLNSNIYDEFKSLGIAHIIAISGMHISIFILILTKLLFFISKDKRNILIIIFLLFYSYIINFSISVLRVVICYILKLLNEKYNINISYYKILFISLFIILLVNPFNIYKVSLLYSYSCSFCLALISKYLSKNYFKNILIITFYLNLFTLPITISLNYEINLLLFISNLIMIPYITYLLYPFSLITYIFPKLLFIYKYLTDFMEYIIRYLDMITIFKISIPKLNIIVIFLYYILLLLFIYFTYKRYFILLISLLVVNKYSYYLDSSLYVTYLDVGQADSILIRMPYYKKIILIDTGGNNNDYYIKNIILYLKSIGINKIDYLLISHADKDHMGDSIYLVNNFNVSNVSFNCGNYDTLENDLIDVLKEKNINYYTCINNLKVDNYALNFLNTGIYDNENDNSSVIYFKYSNYKFLFMGDSSVEREKDILGKYRLNNIDFLKVGHHGSDTSSSKEFISSINPKYSIISVGKNNRYGHPKGSVLKTLENNNSKIYRTDTNGSIEIKIKSDGYSIETCEP